MRCANLFLSVLFLVLFLNPNSVRAQPAPTVYQVPDPRIPRAAIESVAMSHELDSFRFKVALLGYFSGAGEVQTGVPKLQIMGWVSLTQHFGLEFLGNFGYMRVETGGMEQGVDTLFMTGLIQAAYRTHLDKIQCLAGIGYDRMSTTQNSDVVNSFVASVAMRWQPWEHFGFEARYTFGPGWFGGGDDPLYRQEAGAGVYWAY